MRASNKTTPRGGKSKTKPQPPHTVQRSARGPARVIEGGTKFTGKREIRPSEARAIDANTSLIDRYLAHLGTDPKAFREANHSVDALLADARVWDALQSQPGSTLAKATDDAKVKAEARAAGVKLPIPDYTEFELLKDDLPALIQRRQQASDDYDEANQAIEALVTVSEIKSVRCATADGRKWLVTNFPPSKSSRLDKLKLVEVGVTAAQIARATVESDKAGYIQIAEQKPKPPKPPKPSGGGR